VLQPHPTNQFQRVTTALPALPDESRAGTFAAMILPPAWSLFHRPAIITSPGTLVSNLSLPHASLLVVLLLSLLCVGQAHAIDPRTTLACHVRSYQFRVVKPTVLDSHGRVLRCAGSVTVNSCWGRCDSSEIGDYVMPYRISHHPVCTYTDRIWRRVTLQGCGDYPDPTVEVFDAASCECKLCDSDFTSCENLNG